MMGKMGGEERTVMDKKKIAWWSFAGAVIILWLSMFFGGVLLVLWNAFSPRMLRYEQGDLGYYVLQMLFTPAGACLGIYFVGKLVGEGAHVFKIVNYSICAAFCAFVIGLSVYTATATFTAAVGEALTIILFAIYITKESKEIKNGSAVGEN